MPDILYYQEHNRCSWYDWKTIFCNYKNNHTILAAFLNSEVNRISTLVDFDPPGIEKLTGDNSKEEKERVMQRFKIGRYICAN